MNVAGALVGRPNGGFSGSCHDCKFSNDDAADEAEFKCTCESDSGPNETVIPLRKYSSFIVYCATYALLQPPPRSRNGKVKEVF